MQRNDVFAPCCCAEGHNLEVISHESHCSRVRSGMTGSSVLQPVIFEQPVWNDFFGNPPGSFPVYEIVSSSAPAI
jgi:hypothetical protein